MVRIFIPAWIKRSSALTLAAAAALTACAPPQVRTVVRSLDGTNYAIRITEYVTSGPRMQSTTYEVEFEGQYYDCAQPSDASCAETIRDLKAGRFQERIKSAQEAFADGNQSGGAGRY